MWSFVVLYRRPPQPDAFLESYRSTHVPFVKRFPGLRDMTISIADTGEEGSDQVFMISTMYFENAEDLRFALKSPERALAYADSARFRDYQIGRYVCQIEHPLERV